MKFVLLALFQGNRAVIFSHYYNKRYFTYYYNDNKHLFSGKVLSREIISNYSFSIESSKCDNDPINNVDYEKVEICNSFQILGRIDDQLLQL